MQNYSLSPDPPKTQIMLFKAVIVALLKSSVASKKRQIARLIPLWRQSGRKVTLKLQNLTNTPIHMSDPKFIVTNSILSVCAGRKPTSFDLSLSSNMLNITFEETNGSSGPLSIQVPIDPEVRNMWPTTEEFIAALKEEGNVNNWYPGPWA